MIVLTLVFCLIADPTSCREQRATVTFPSKQACFLAAQQYAAPLTELYGAYYRLDHFTCGPPEEKT